MKLADLLISSAGCTVFGSADKDVKDLIYHSDKGSFGQRVLRYRRTADRRQGIYRKKQLKRELRP